MTKEMITRDDIVRSVVDALRPLDYVYALWEGGAVAFNRVDRWSDVDICVDADDERVADCFPVAERALEALAPIALKFEVKQTMSPGYVQAFYRLEGTSEYLLLDFAVFKHSWPDKLLEPEVHNQAKFHFNKGGMVEIPHLDEGKLRGQIGAALASLTKRLETFGCFVDKEIHRGNSIEAVTLYHRLALDPLVDVLRIKYRPERHGFRTRYIHYDLPADVVARLERLFFIRDTEDLAAKLAEARRWLRDTLREVERSRRGTDST